MKINKYIITLLIALIMLASASGCRAKPTDNPDLTENQTTGTCDDRAKRHRFIKASKNNSR